MQDQIDWRDCDNKPCNEPTPMDMAGIIIDDEIYCSPDCAKAALKERVEQPTIVKLHDPQFAVDRDEIGIDDDAVDIWRLGEPAADMVDAYADIYPGEFRVDPHE